MYSIQNEKLKEKCAKTGVSELVIDGDVSLYNVKKYKSYIDYCNLKIIAW